MTIHPREAGTAAEAVGTRATHREVIRLSSAGRFGGAQRPADELRRALDILGRHVRQAVAVRRATSRSDPRYRRAGEELARLSGLYRRMQRRMEIPPEVWDLDAPASERRRRGAGRAASGDRGTGNGTSSEPSDDGRGNLDDRRHDRS